MSKPPFLLVHGAWLGGWSWDRIRPLLEVAGHEVIAPTLAGLAERHDPGQPAPSLGDHVTDVVGAAGERSDIVLVGHSYGGMVVTGAADRLRGRLRRVVYLDAAVPADGQDFASHIPGLDAEGAARRRAAFTDLAPDGDWIPTFPAAALGLTAPDDLAWVEPRLTPHPLRTWLEPVRLKHGGVDGLPKTYVLVTAPRTELMGYPVHGERAQAGGEWTYREVATGHCLMITEPARTAELLLEAAQ